MRPRRRCPHLATGPRSTPDDLEYSHVSARGVYAADKEALVFRAGRTAPDAAIEPGFWVMTPLMLPGGASVLVNRGFIAADAKDKPRAPPVGEVTVTGLLRAPEEHGAFTPADAPDKGQWFTRDPAAIAAAMGIAQQAAPFSIDADAAPAPPGQPAGGATVIDIPNSHLSYAITWFGLAAALAAMTIISAMRRRGGFQGAGRDDASATAATTSAAPPRDSGSSVSPNQT